MAFTCGRDWHLKLPPADHGGIVEIAVLGMTHHVATHITALRLAENRFVHFVRRSSRDHEKHVIEIKRRNLSCFPADPSSPPPSQPRRIGLRRNRTNRRAGEQQTANLSFGN